MGKIRTPFKHIIFNIEVILHVSFWKSFSLQLCQQEKVEKQSYCQCVL